MARLSALLLLLTFQMNLYSQTPKDLAIPIQVATPLNPPAVVLLWPASQPATTKLSRRTKGQAGNAWTTLINETNSLQSGYYDTGVAEGQTYEYALERQTGNQTASGYAHAAIFAPVVDNRGKMLVFIDSTSADQLGADLVKFKNDLRGEGWQILPYHTGNSITVQWVKNKIIAAYNADPGQVKAVLLLGNVPIPYSGSTAWDGQSDHAGAWPCDAYYGDIDGIWTDNSVNLPALPRPANRNVPGDGKYDQSILPSAVELAVGRVDFRRLSIATFGLSPVELLRRYLQKNHLWRTGQYQVAGQALVDDELGWAGGEAFASGGFRNAYPLLGENKVFTGEFLTQTGTQSYLMGYGAGTIGAYSSAGGIGNSANFAANTVNAVFTSFYGDYFGDWDYESNPLLPAILASKGGVLSCAWAGRPQWFSQGLASGETMGYCLKETQNAQFNDGYVYAYGGSSSPIALLGDPSLRAQIVSPVGNLTVNSNCNKVNLHWTAPADSTVLGYFVYRAFDANGPYTRLTTDLVTQTAWADLAPVNDTLYYAVRSVRLEQTPGGGVFYNSSTGILGSVIFVPGTAPTVLGLGGVLNCAHTSLTLGANFQPSSCTVQWYKPNATPLGGYIATEGGIYTVIATAPNGCTAAASATVYVDTTLPVINLPGLVTLNCTTPEVVFVVPETGPEIHYTFNGSAVAAGASISLLNSGTLQVSSDQNGCSDSYSVVVQYDDQLPGADAGTDGNTLDCSHAFVQLTGFSGTAGVDYAWSGNGFYSTLQDPSVTQAGDYCLTVTASNGCTSSDCVTVTAANGTISIALSSTGNPCDNSVPAVLQAGATGGVSPYQYAWSTGATNAEITLPAGFTGTVSLSVTDVNNCLAIASFFQAPPLSTLALTHKPSSAITTDGTIELIVLDGSPPFTFQWNNGSTQQNLEGLSSGIYLVTVTDSHDCTTTLTVSLITVGVREPGEEIDVRIAPNPAEETLGVYLNWNSVPVSRVWICDLSGRVLADKQGMMSAYFFDVRDWKTGVYVLWVETGGRRKVYKVVVGR